MILRLACTKFSSHKAECYPVNNITEAIETVRVLKKVGYTNFELLVYSPTLYQQQFNPEIDTVDPDLENWIVWKSKDGKFFNTVLNTNCIEDLITAQEIIDNSPD